MTICKTIAVADRITVSNDEHTIAVIIDERIEEYIRFKRKYSGVEVFFDERSVFQTVRNVAF